MGPDRSLKRWRPFVAFIFVLGAVGCGALDPDPNDRLMSDEEMSTRFRQERASFDSLANIVGEEHEGPPVCIFDAYGLDYGHLDGAGGARQVTSRRLLRRIRVGRNVWSDSAGVLFQQYVQKLGPVNSHWMRGYYYARQPITQASRIRQDDLIEDQPTLRHPWEGQVLYKHLDGPWYLYSNHGYSD